LSHYLPNLPPPPASPPAQAEFFDLSQSDRTRQRPLSAQAEINSVLQQATAASVQEIDKLITELQAVRDMLHSEAARVQREIVQYSTLTQAALQSTKTIAESLEQWRTAPDLRTVSD
jgi:hypothetical protein